MINHKQRIGKPVIRGFWHDCSNQMLYFIKIVVGQFAPDLVVHFALELVGQYAPDLVGQYDWDYALQIQ